MASAAPPSAKATAAGDVGLVVGGGGELNARCWNWRDATARVKAQRTSKVRQRVKAKKKKGAMRTDAWSTSERGWSPTGSGDGPGEHDEENFLLQTRRGRSEEGDVGVLRASCLLLKSGFREIGGCRKVPEGRKRRRDRRSHRTTLSLAGIWHRSTDSDTRRRQKKTRQDRRRPAAVAEEKDRRFRSRSSLGQSLQPTPSPPSERQAS